MEKHTKVAIGLNLLAVAVITFVIHKLNVIELKEGALSVTIIWIIAFLMVQVGYFTADCTSSRGWARASLWSLVLMMALRAISDNFIITRDGLDLVGQISQHQMGSIMGVICGGVMGMMIYFAIKEVEQPRTISL